MAADLLQPDSAKKCLCVYVYVCVCVRVFDLHMCVRVLCAFVFVFICLATFVYLCQLSSSHDGQVPEWFLSPLPPLHLLGVWQTRGVDLIDRLACVPDIPGSLRG